MSEHMKTPWSWHPDIDDGPSMDWNVFDADGMLVCVTAEEDARRIVAAVNACAGIPTETLELVPNFEASGVKTIREVEKQRDDLLAAAQAATAIFAGQKWREDAPGAEAIALKMLRAAIAAAEGREVTR